MSKGEERQGREGGRGEGRTCGEGIDGGRGSDGGGSTKAAGEQRRRWGIFFVDLAVEGSDAHTTKSWNYYPRRFGVNAGGNLALTNMWAIVSFHRRKGPNSPGVYFFSFPAGETPLVV
jgi:hypothetical protein